MFEFLFVLATLSTLTSGLSIPQPEQQQAPQNRIVGGDYTTIEKFPYQVSVRIWESHRCGGSIIKPDRILTSAHCVYGQELKSLQIIAGSSHLQEDGAVRQVSSVKIHENYDEWENDYDIALLTLESPMDYTNSVQPIVLARSSEEIRDGTKALVSGWGTSSETGWFSSNTLRSVEVFVVGNEECAKNYQGKERITERMMCAGHPAGGRDSCYGDEGGPLTLGGKLYGIVSWSLGCARRDYPGVYVKVAAFRDWIDEQIKA